MATERQIQANKLNALRSTGPITTEGKSVSRLNALKHGISAKTVLMKHEDPELFETALLRLREEIEPIGSIE